MTLAANSQPLLSLVVPMYNESEAIGLFFARVRPVLESITEQYEIICINDGSKDNTLELIKAEHARDPRVRYLSLSRNFGKETALTAGLHHTTGQAVIPLDCDLQDPPELIPEMVAKWREGFKVVLATRSNRSGDSFMKRFTANLFYKLIGKLSTVPIPSNTGDFRLMDEQVVQVIRLLPERTRFMKGLFAWVGFKTTTIYFERPSRSAGETKYNYVTMWRHAKDGIFSFTTAPLRFTTYMGMLISVCAFAYAFFIIIRTLVYGIDLPGYASIMAVILFIGGIQLLSIGILGEYIGRIYREAKHRPLFIVEEHEADHH